MSRGAYAASVLVGVTALAGMLAGPARAQDPGGQPAAGAPAQRASVLPLTTPRERALARQREDRVARLDSLSRSRTSPFLVSPAADDPTIVLTPRPAPYTVTDVRSLFPAALLPGERSSLLLVRSVFVARGASLRISGREVRSLRLLSTPSRFVALTGWRSTIGFAGSRRYPLTVTSWDPGRGRPDGQARDGRAFILVRGSSMSSSSARFSHLGFGGSRTSGVAWVGLDAVPARGVAATPSTGEVTSSTFTHNRIGAFTDRAPEMSWIRNQFSGNEGHGFDAHDRCRALVLDGNTAARNGGHGFLLARGCRDNLLQGNVAAQNRASGIVLDEGEAAPIASARNTVISNRAVGNAVAGLVVNGGTGNRLRGNAVRGGTTGIEIRDSRGNPVEGNTVSDVDGPGIDLDGGASNRVTGNRVERSHIGLYLKRAARASVASENQILASGQFGVYLAAGAGRNRVSGNYLEGGFSGIRAKDARGNWILGNTVVEATDSGISLHGDVRGTLVLDNRVSGRGGPAPIELQSDAAGLAGVRVEGNQTAGWVVARRALSPVDQLRNFVRFHPTVLFWACVLLLPSLLWPLRVWHRRRQRRWRQATASRLALGGLPDGRDTDA